tara:strand:+ start:179 stop:442 length:264 start_codon:yes stop_codon:yes gene_type:complete
MGYFSDKQIEEEESKTFGEVTFAELRNTFPDKTHEQIKIGYLFMHFNPIRYRKVMSGIFSRYDQNLLVCLEEALYAIALNRLYTAHH